MRLLTEMLADSGLLHNGEIEKTLERLRIFRGDVGHLELVCWSKGKVKKQRFE